MSARSTTWPSAWHTYCCLSRDLSGRCSILNEMPWLRAPEKRRTGIEMSPKVKWPDQTDDGMFRTCPRSGAICRTESLANLRCAMHPQVCDRNPKANHQLVGLEHGRPKML